MGAVRRPVKPNRTDPGPDDPGVLPSREMGRLGNATRKEELLRLQMSGRDPRGDRIPRLLGDLKLHRSLSLPLHHNRAGCDMTTLDHVVNAKPYQVTASQLAVDSEVEQREFPDPMVQLQSNPDCPDLLQFQRRLLAEQFAFVPRYCTPCGRRGGIREQLLC